MAGGFRSLFAFWLGGGASKTIVPSVITDVRSGHLRVDAGELKLRSDSGNLFFRTDGGQLHLVITS